MNDLLGVLGAPDPAAALRALGVEPGYADDRVALGGASVWMDPEKRVVVCGELILDGGEAGTGELLVDLYRQHGARGPARLRGKISAAIWDRDSGRLVLVRDGVGHRTMYYSVGGNGTHWFAARLRSLAAAPTVSRQLSLTALRNYLTYSFVPGHETLLRDVLEVRPGCTVTLPGRQEDCYWEPEEQQWDPEEPLEAHARRLRSILEDAVRDRLPESGPVGAYLSGGLDSSLVTALVAKHAPGPVHTYSIHFGDKHPNELPFANRVAEHCGTRHQVLTVSARAIRRALLQTLDHLDDPIGDALTVPNFLLGRRAADDVGVIFNGEGGDPCFGGPKNHPMLLNHLYGPEESRERAYLRSYKKCYEDLDTLLRPEIRQELESAEPQEELPRRFFESDRMRHFLNRLMHLNVRLKGADQILTKVNNLTTANGLLGRSPLFDQRVVAASFAIPPTYKLDGVVEKAVLKKAVEDLLPREVVYRRKSGMRVPVQDWFRRELRRLAKRMLLGRGARLRRYLNEETLRETLDYRRVFWSRHGAKLWLLVSLEAWMRVREIS